MATVDKTAVILLSGGLDSVTLLALARSEGYQCHTLSFAYGQRHTAELAAAADLSMQYGAKSHRVVPIDLGSIGGSALTDHSLSVPVDGVTDQIPITYVPARNTIFLAYALGVCEVLDADALFVGVNAVDYSGYPDCRPEFIDAFQSLANLATKAGVEGHGVVVQTPLIALSKAEIIKLGVSLGVDYSQTVSCYSADEQGRACGLCDSCRLRKQGFSQAGLDDPTRYQA
ncbi:7-cyano-7-deazaguanine synthase QueC [Thiomicrospira sp. ALE5]|uniref:7-cyano-7-deazaguanine synthase QueC n=1 Tax=Thiomicrospira sp. ALE5 TaxID=748650 RepID=UPI0008F1B727|nr:7-cyano-7-deazaguanine synthase QueC [Thiomicrospira sp. ALE5]SFR51093.1 preQ(0) biosynthesis protein QueC [Thiomicrospira sp. ALE5]